jgi:hypothetical protein
MSRPAVGLSTLRAFGGTLGWVQDIFVPFLLMASLASLVHEAVIVVTCILFFDAEDDLFSDHTLYFKSIVRGDRVPVMDLLGINWASAFAHC